MSISPEQFNKIVTKDDLELAISERLVTKDEFNSKINQIMNVLDGIASNVQELINAQHLNQTAHDRYNENFIKIKAKKFEEVEVV